MPPSKANGKICYLEIPALDIKRSADFYTRVFGWRIRTRGDGSIAFDDAVNEVSGSWVRGRKAWSEPGLHAVAQTAGSSCSRSVPTPLRSRRGLRIPRAM